MHLPIEYLSLRVVEIINKLTSLDIKTEIDKGLNPNIHYIDDNKIHSDSNFRTQNDGRTQVKLSFYTYITPPYADFAKNLLPLRPFIKKLQP